MSESASALFSIADADEFRFARFYIVCEAVPLGTPESPPIVCGLPDTSCGLSKRGKDTEWDAICGMEEIREFCFKESAAVCLFWNFFVLWFSGNITYQRKTRYAYCGSSFLSIYHRRNDRLSVAIQKRRHSSRISACVKHIIHASFLVHPDFRGRHRSLGINLFKSLILCHFSSSLNWLCMTS